MITLLTAEDINSDLFLKLLNMPLHHAFCIAQLTIVPYITTVTFLAYINTLSLYSRLHCSAKLSLFYSISPLKSCFSRPTMVNKSFLPFQFGLRISLITCYFTYCLIFTLILCFFFFPGCGTEIEGIGDNWAGLATISKWSISYLLTDFVTSVFFPALFYFYVFWLPWWASLCFI